MRNVVIMLVLVVLLGGFWYFHDVKGLKDKNEETARIERVFPEFKALDVSSVTWSNGKSDKDTIRCFRRVEPGWVVEFPDKVQMRVDVPSLNSACEDLSRMARVALISEKPSQKDLAQYGLDKPLHRIQIDFKNKDGAASKAVMFIGKPLFDDSGSYARMESAAGDAPVIAVPGKFITFFMTPLAELRESSLLTFSCAKVRKVKFTSYEGTNPGSFTLEAEEQKSADASEGKSGLSKMFGGGEEEEAKSEDPEGRDLEEPESSKLDWYVSGNGVEGRVSADANTCSEFLWNLQSAKISQYFLHNDASRVKPRRARFEFTIDGMKEPIVYELGQIDTAKGIVCASRSNPQEYFSFQYKDIPDAMQVLFGKRAPDFVDRHLARKSIEDVQRLEAGVVSKRAEGDYVVEAIRVKGGWDVKKPNPAINSEARRLEIVDKLLYDALDLQWVIKERAKSGEAGKAEKAAWIKLYDGKSREPIYSADICREGDDRCVVYADGFKMVLSSDPRDSWIQAAEDLFGGSKDDKKAVENKNSGSAGSGESAKTDTPSAQSVQTPSAGNAAASNK